LYSYPSSWVNVATAGILPARAVRW